MMYPLERKSPVIYHWPYRIVAMIMFATLVASVFFITAVSAGFYSARSSSSSTFEIPTFSNGRMGEDTMVMMEREDGDDHNNIDSTDKQQQQQEQQEQEEGDESPYLIIIDGGSTGSRLHIFEFVESTVNESDNDSDTDSAPHGTYMECHRRGSARTDSPLSEFGRSQPEIDAGVVINATALARHFASVFDYAATIVPNEFHASTRVLYQATAGMRLLTLDEQEAVYDAMYGGWMQDENFSFKQALRRTDIATLSGDLEGYYGAVAANYLEGIVNAKLELVVGPKTAEQEQDAQQYEGPIGALDMGGSSTQIVFLPPSSSSSSTTSPDRRDDTTATTITQQQQQQFAQSASSHTLDAESDMQSCFAVYDESQGAYTQACEPSQSSSQQQQRQQKVLQGEDFFSTSYLSYGVDQFRERLWTTWVQDHIEQQQHQQQQFDDDSDDGSCDSRVIADPCSFVGYQQEWLGHTLIGTGDAEACVDQVRLLIPHPDQKTIKDDDDNDDDQVDQPRVVGGIAHPPVRGKFFAMSLYFFTLDALRELSSNNPAAHAALNKSWPTPSIQELVDSLDGLCSRSWHGDLYDIQHSAHTYTRAQVLPHRCLESVYMVTLLKDGFGFAPESRDITFTFLVDGNEVEWTLGMALVMQQEKQKREATRRRRRRRSTTTDSTTMAITAAAPNEEVSTTSREFSNNMDKKNNNTWKEERRSISSSSSAPVCSPSDASSTDELVASTRLCR